MNNVFTSVINTYNEKCEIQFFSNILNVRTKFTYSTIYCSSLQITNGLKTFEVIMGCL